MSSQRRSTAKQNLILIQPLYKLLTGAVILGLLGGCAKLFFINQPRGSFEELPTPSPPDYSKEEYWAALPWRKDAADHVPGKSPWRDRQDSARADLFYIHPTTAYTPRRWNASVDNKFIRFKVDQFTIRGQAAVFNGSCKIYAPRYRQAVLYAYYDLGPAEECRGKNSGKAFALAYQDVLRAFQYYLKHYNNGRPIILAGHSQGTEHCLRLLEEEFYGTPLEDQLVAAYLAGLPGDTPWLHATRMPFCCDPDATGCWMTWNSMRADTPEDWERRSYWALPQIVNPITWKCDTDYAPAQQNPGSVRIFPPVRRKDKPLFGGRIEEGIMLVTPRKRLGFPRFYRYEYHWPEFHLYYQSIRENVANRVAHWYERQPDPGTNEEQKP